MAPPVTSEFKLFDWDGGVKLTDSTNGLIAAPEAEFNFGSPNVIPYFDIEASALTGTPEVDDVLTGVAPATWTFTVTHIISNTKFRGYITGPSPEPYDFFTGTVDGRVEVVDGVIAFSSTGERVYTRMSYNIPAASTLEVRLLINALPQTANSTSDYLFLGFVGQLGTGAGLRFSKQGVSIAVQSSDIIPTLPGSEGLAVTNTDLTLRLATDPDNDKILIYVTETSQVAYTGHILRYESPIPAAAPFNNQFLLEIASTGSLVACELKSLRCDNSLIVPNARPIADPGDDDEVQLGEPVELNGTDSYDPEGELLTYYWYIESQPENSDIFLQDPGSATYTIHWSGASLTFTSKRVGTLGDGLDIRIQTGAAFSVSYDSSLDQITIEYTGTEDIQDVLDAFTPGDPYYDSASAAQVSVSATGTLTSLLFTASGALDGGSDGTGRTNFFNPENLGVYRIGLRVNDGSLTSAKVIQTINVVESRSEMGYVPDGNYIWTTISDFWQLVKGKDHITTIFSSFIQMLTAEMVKAWQHEDSKSLATIHRLFQRRWMNYSPKLDEEADHLVGENIFPIATDSGTAQPLRPGSRYGRLIVLTGSTIGGIKNFEAGDSIVVWPEWDVPRLNTIAKFEPIKRISEGYIPDAGGGVMYLRDPNTDFVALGVEAGDTVQITNATPTGPEGQYKVLSIEAKALQLAGPAVSSATTVDYIIGGILHIDEEDLEVLTLIDEGTADAYRDEADYDKYTLSLRSGEFDSGIEAGDTLRLFNPVTGAQIGDDYEIQTATTEYIRVLSGGGDPELPAVTGVSWEVVRDRTGDIVYVCGYHVFEVSDVEDLTTEITVNDTVRCLVTIDSQQYDWYGDVIAIRGSRFAAHPHQYVSGGLYELSLEGAATYDAFKTLWADDFEVTEIWRTSRIPLDETVRQIPRLQESPGDPSGPLLFSRDYLIEDDDGDKYISWIEIVDVLINPPTAGIPLIVAASDVDFDELGVTVGSTIVIDILGGEGLDPNVPFGSAEVVSIPDSNILEVDWAKNPQWNTDDWYEACLDYLGSPSVWVRAYILSYGAYNLPPASLWAEATYYDNSQQIEDNFGLAVGLTKDMVDSEGSLRLDYLSSTKALWFAFWTGPTLANIRLGAQVFFNLPFAEEAGTILSIDENYTSDIGRITIRSDVDETRIKTYFYPTALGPDDNPETGVPYVIGDHVDLFAPLCQGIEVIDYVKDPDWIIGALEGEQEPRKFHTFKIGVDLSAHTDDLAAASENVVNFVKTIKPRHTDFFLIGLQSIVDTIDVDDEVFFKATYPFIDDIYTTRDYGSWLPTSGGKTLRSGFIHYLDHYDAELNQPLHLFPDYSDKTRTKLWLTCSARTSTFLVGETIFHNSGDYPLQVIYDGPSYVVCRYISGVYQIGPEPGWSVGETVQEKDQSESDTAQAGGANSITLAATASGTNGYYNSWKLVITAGTGAGQTQHVQSYDGTTKVATFTDSWTVTPDGTSQYTVSYTGKWEGIVYNISGANAWVAVSPDSSRGVPRIGDVVQGTSLSTTLTTAALLPFDSPAASDVLRNAAGTSTLTVDAITEFPDLIGNLDRKLEVGPEAYLDYRSAFYCGGSNALTISCSALSGINSTDIIYENAGGTPAWVAKVLYVSGLDVDVDHTSGIKQLTAASTSGFAAGNLIYETSTFEAGRVMHVINSTTMLVEPTTRSGLLVPGTYTNGTVTTSVSASAAYTNNTPIATETFQNSVGGSGTVSSVAGTGGRRPMLDIGLVADDLELFHTPVDRIHGIFVEVDDASGFSVGEQVKFQTYPHHSARIREAGLYWVSLWSTTWMTPSPGVVLEGVDSGHTATVTRVWDRDEYCVPSTKVGRYAWAGQMFTSDYILRIYYTGTQPAGPDTELRDATYTPHRWRGTIVTANATYVDVTPTPGFLRSQPVRGQALQAYPSTNSMTVRSESWALQWVPGSSVINDIALCRVVVADDTPVPRFPRKPSTYNGDTVIIDALGG